MHEQQLRQLCFATFSQVSCMFTPAGCHFLDQKRQGFAFSPVSLLIQQVVLVEGVLSPPPALIRSQPPFAFRSREHCSLALHWTGSILHTLPLPFQTPYSASHIDKLT